MACSVITRPTAVRVAHLISDRRSYARQIAYVGWDRIGCTSRFRGPGSGLLSSRWGSQGWIFRPFSHGVQRYPHLVRWEASGGQLTGGPPGSLPGAARRWGTRSDRVLERLSAPHRPHDHASDYAPSPAKRNNEGKAWSTAPPQLPWWGRIQVGERDVSRCTQHCRRLPHA
jgi:hypothetical protein